MRYIVYGAGGIGCTIGGHLHRVGHEVVLVGNPDHMAAIRARGMAFLTGDGTHTLEIPAFDSAADITPFRDDDVVLLCAESQHTARCVGQLKNAGAPPSLPIVCCQNSIWNEPTVSRAFVRVYGAVIAVRAIFLKPGEVINPLSKRAGFIEVGCYPMGRDELCEAVARDLTEASFTANANAEVMQAKGAKCLGNLGNALQAITDGRGGTEVYLGQVQREAETVWAAAGIDWEDRERFWERRRQSEEVAKRPPGYEDFKWGGSSWQSLTRATGSIEAEELNGDVVRLGAYLKIPTPYNLLLLQLATEMAEKHEPPGKFSADELMGMIPSESDRGRAAL